MKNSKLVIVIAHFNNVKGLENSLRSIDESFDIDIIIVDDGSKNKPDEAYLRSIYSNGNLFFEYLKENSGVGIAANLGLKKAVEYGYELISRFDCGDFCKKDKFAKQLQFLKENPEIKLLGTWANVLNEEGELLHYLKHPTSYEEIKKKMYLNSMFLNPSVVFYADILEKVGGYQEKYKRAAQDYAFFFKVIKYYKAANYPEFLIDFVVEENSISTTKRKLQVKNRILIILDNFYFGFYPIYGLLRSCILYFVSRETTTTLKKVFKKNGN